MRVLVVDHYYPDFLARHYEANPGLEEQSYEQQLGSLLSRCFGTFDAFSRHLQGLGHDAANLVVNCEPLQAAWGREHGLVAGRLLPAAGRAPGRLRTAARLPLLHRIAARQIRDFEPDVLYLHSLHFFGPRQLERFRGEGIKVVGQIASPAPSQRVLQRFDLIVSSFPHFVERFRELGVRSEYLRIAFDPAVLERLRHAGVAAEPETERGHEVAFVGGLNPAVHGRRVALLERLCRDLPIEIWGYGAEALPSHSPINERYRGIAYGLDMYRVLAQSKIVINTHIEAAEGYANNMRLYEATGVGALLITEAAPNLADLFEPGREVMAYRDADEVVAQVRRHLDDDADRRRVAAAGQARTLAEHTYEQRIGELSALLEEVVGG